MASTLGMPVHQKVVAAKKKFDVTLWSAVYAHTEGSQVGGSPDFNSEHISDYGIENISSTCVHNESLQLSCH